MSTKQPEENASVKIPEPDICTFDPAINRVIKAHSGSQMRGYAHERVKQALSRQHAEIEALQTGYAAARLEIASLQARIAERDAQEYAIGAGGMEPLRKRECLHKVSEPAVAQAPVASIYITNDGQREFDDWRAPLPVGRNELFAAPQPAAQALDAASVATLIEVIEDAWAHHARYGEVGRLEGEPMIHADVLEKIHDAYLSIAAQQGASNG